MASGHIIVVDEDSERAARTAAQIEGIVDGLSTIPAADVTEVIRNVLRAPPDAVVLEAPHTELETERFIECLHRLEPGLPIVLLLDGAGPRSIDPDIADDSRVELIRFDADRIDYRRVADSIQRAMADRRGPEGDLDRRWREDPAFAKGPDPMLIIDDDGVCVTANELAREFLDGGSEIIGSPLGGYVESGLNFDDHWRDFCVNDRDRGTLPVRMPDDTTRQLEYAASLNVEPGRHLVGFRDVTDRVRSERALSILHETTRELLEGDSPEAVCETAVAVADRDLEFPIAGIWLHDAETDALEPVALSPGARQYVDGRAEPIGRGEGIVWDAFITADIRIFDDADGTGIFESTDDITAEMIVSLGGHGVLAVGSVSDELFGWTTVRLAQLLAANTETALDNVTRESELIRQTTALERQNERLDAVASVLSHDLRNPLTVANGHLELAREQIESAGQTHLQTVGRALERMDELISDVLSMAREGKAVLESERIDLEPAVRTAWQTSGTASAELVVDGALGDIDADESRLRTLLENVFRNAVEHGGPTVTVRVGALDSGGFYVADDGPGIPEGDRESAFTFGYSTDDDGTGIGLSIVESIAEAHGWTVAIADSWAGGARFEVRT